MNLMRRKSGEALLVTTIRRGNPEVPVSKMPTLLFTGEDPL